VNVIELNPQRRRGRNPEAMDEQEKRRFAEVLLADPEIVAWLDERRTHEADDEADDGEPPRAA